MKQLLIANESGTPIYYVDEEGQILCSLLLAFQLYVKNNFGEFARAVTSVAPVGDKKNKVQVALQVHGRLYFVAISDQGEPASELDTELQLAHDLLGLSVSPNAFYNKHVRLWKNKGHHSSFLRLVDTSMKLCTQYPSVLVRSLEQLEINTSIRTICAQALKNQYEDLPEFKGAAVFVGTRVLAQYQPGDVITDNTTDIANSAHKGGITVYDFFLLMLHVQSIFNPVIRPKKKAPQKTSVGEEEEGSVSTGISSSTSNGIDIKGDNEDGDDMIASSPSLSSSFLSTSPLTPQRIQGTRISTRKITPSPSPTTSSSSSSLSSSTTSESKGSTPSVNTTYKHKGKIFESLKGLADNLSGGLLSNWLPDYVRDTAYVSQVYLSNGKPHVVYCAELMEGIYISIVLGISDKEVLKQRNILVRAHMAYRDWLMKDYAAFLLTKRQAHMPILSYISSVPGVVHFIFVDRLRNFAIAPSVAPLYGQDSKVTHTADSLIRLIYKLVHYSHTHLAYGCTTMMVKAKGFHFSYRLCIECNNESLPDFANVKTDKHMPWVVSPQLYSDLIEFYHSSYCYELYTLYLGSIPISAISQKDYQLLKAISTLTDHPFHF